MVDITKLWYIVSLCQRRSGTNLSLACASRQTVQTICQMVAESRQHRSPSKCDFPANPGWSKFRRAGGFPDYASLIRQQFTRWSNWGGPLEHRLGSTIETIEMSRRLWSLERQVDFEGRYSVSRMLSCFRGPHECRSPILIGRQSERSRAATRKERA